MSTKRIVTYICPQKVCAMDVDSLPPNCGREDDGSRSDSSGPSGVTTSLDGYILNVEIPLVQIGIDPEGSLGVTIKLQPDDIGIPALCNTYETPLTYRILGRVDSDYQPYGAYYISINAKLPYTACNFAGAKIEGEFCGVIEEYTPTNDGVVDESITTVFSVSSSFDTPIDENPSEGDPGLVPGEKITLYWQVTGSTEWYEVAHVYFHTCCLTGGRITAVNGDYGSTDITYSVLVEGVNKNTVPSSDFKEYSVSDWVYMIKPTYVGCERCGRTSGCVGDSADDTDTLIIIPLDIVGGGPT